MSTAVAPPPQDWKGMQTQVSDAATKQTSNNRLNTSNPFASQTFNADGSTSTQFTGGLGEAADGLQNQAAGMSQPMDWSRFAPAGTGDSARDQAIQGAYGQATSRLNPMWNQREDQARTRLMNQGLDPSSEAFQNEMQGLGRDRNDAYSSAMSGAISQGTAAGDSIFRNNMTARQQAIAEALKARGMPMEELSRLQGFLAQPGYNADNSTLAGAMGSTGLQKAGGDDAWNRYTYENGQGAATAGGVTSGVGTALSILPFLFSDERLKTDIVRHAREVLPGVPFATWKWKSSGDADCGVIAQDVQKVRPDLVREHPSGFLMVNYAGLETR